MFELYIKYLLEGIAVAIAAYFIPRKKVEVAEIIFIALSAAATFAVLDIFAPKVGDGARKGAGFGIGANTVGWPGVGLERFDDGKKSDKSSSSSDTKSTDSKSMDSKSTTTDSDADKKWCDENKEKAKKCKTEKFYGGESTDSSKSVESKSTDSSKSTEVKPKEEKKEKTEDVSGFNLGNGNGKEYASF